MRKGEPLYELDTDKVTQEVEAEASGVLLKIAVTEGEVEVGRTIGFIGAEGEAVGSDDGAPVSAEKPARAPKREPEREEGRAAAAAAAEAQPGPTADGSSNGRIKASPLARRIARERGIELSQVSGTGPDGRIVAEDVERAQAGPAPLEARHSKDRLRRAGSSRGRSRTSARRSPAGSRRPGPCPRSS